MGTELAARVAEFYVELLAEMSRSEGPAVALLQGMEPSELRRRVGELNAAGDEFYELLTCAEEIEKVIARCGRLGWAIVLSAVERSPSRSILGLVAARALEECLHTSRLVSIAERVSVAARKSEKFRFAFLQVWDLPEALSRVQREVARGSEASSTK